MREKEILETPIWQLYEKGRNYHRMTNIYTDTDKNYRFYNGNQWEGAKLGDVEPVQINFIRPIVNYKLSVIHANLYAPKYSSQNYENHEFHKQAEKVCEMLNGYALRAWEQNKMDTLCRTLTKDAAVNDEGIFYIDFDKENMMPITEVIDKNDIYFANENDSNIQEQPYILIRKRMPVSNAVEFAKGFGVGKSKSELIIGDNDTFEESGDAAKKEVDNQVTVVYKFYRKNGTVHFAVATRLCDIAEDVDIGLESYPFEHFLWQEKKGSARGEGEVRYLIPAQIEVNRTKVRQLLTLKTQAYPHKVVNIDKVENPQALNQVGGIIKLRGQTVDDIQKIVGTLPPAQMSPDVKQTVDDLISVTRELAGAGDTATGDVDPENASGRAILAVQQATQAPITEQKDGFKAVLEGWSKIVLEYLTVYAVDGVNLEETITTETGEEVTRLVKVPQEILKQLKANIKIDITPKSPLDKFAQEQTIENLMMNGLFTAQRVGELKAYANALDDDSVAPKMRILEIVKGIEEEQRKIAMINAQAQMMQQRANQFLMGDPDEQSSQMADAMAKLEQEQFASQEAELDAQVAEEEEALPIEE